MLFVLLGFVFGFGFGFLLRPQPQKVLGETVTPQVYWFELHRKSNIEYLYKGEPGDKEKSELMRAFHVKVGIPGERPTPLPEKMGRKYFLLTKKYEVLDNPEVGHYFIELDIPVGEEEPYGPVPYLECGLDGTQQCNWLLPGAFGLHGINGDMTRLDSTNPGSSGCIRHADADIEYLYKLLDTNSEIRYYIQDI